ncbi:hypothetical protein ACQ8WR_004953, partial [Escherichia coli]
MNIGEQIKSFENKRAALAQGMNVALKDAMLCWGEDEDKPEVDPFAALEDALSFAAQS